MQRSAIRSIAALAALIFCGAISPQVPAADESGTPLELKKLAAPGKVAAVMGPATTNAARSVTSYSFPASASTEAVAVVLKIDDTFYIDGLAPPVKQL